jgi:curved DNA-binding protein CbpA
VVPPESRPPAAADYYALLGVDRLADPETLHRAYRRQAKLVHPDAYPFDSAERTAAEARFKALTTAYETLTDRAMRAAYDASLPPETPPVPEAPPMAPRRPAPRQWEAPADPVMRPAHKPPKPAGGPPAFMDILREATRRRGQEWPDD